MIHIANKPEEKIYRRLARRGYSIDDCKKILANRTGGIAVFKEKRFRNDVKNFTGLKNC